MVSKKQTIRNNDALKAAEYTEYISKEEFENRVKEIIKCKEDINYFAEKYFTIINLDEGEQIIKLFPKQKDLLKFFQENKRCVLLSARQTAKTTSTTIYILWIMLFNEDKNVLICANKEKIAIEIVSKIRLAYEKMPLWLKPGILEYNKSTIKLANNSRVSGISTSPTSARGTSINLLFLDEFAFVPNSICEQFFQSVYPVVSSSKNSQVIMVSTPNGVGNIFYDTWSKANLNIEKSKDGWKPFLMNWWDFPGRDENWKKQTLESMNWDYNRFNQEFGNVFLGSSYTLLPGEKIEQLIKENKDRDAKYQEINILKNSQFEDFKVKIFKQPEKDRVYIVGADVGDGVGKDFSTFLILDVTELKQIEIVASFGCNSIQTSNFAYLLCNAAKTYNFAYIAIERNGIGKAILDLLWDVYFYENIFSYDSTNSNRAGIYSSNSVKTNACNWMRDLFSFPEINFILNENNLVYELQYFERKTPANTIIYQAVNGKHDDYVMSFIWALWMLNPSIVYDYFIVKQTKTMNSGLEIPYELSSYNNEYFKEDSSDTFENKKSKNNKKDNVFDFPKDFESNEYEDEGNFIGFANF